MSQCAHCKQTVAASEQLVACAGGDCNRKFHVSCASLSAAELKVLQINANILWRCNDCVAKSTGGAGDAEAGVGVAAMAKVQQEQQACKLSRYRGNIVNAVTIVLVLALLAVITYEVGHFTQNRTKDADTNATTEKTLSAECGTNGVLCLMDRAAWHALPAGDEPFELTLPVNRIIISHTTTDFCDTQKICISRVQIMQHFHMNSWGWNDIAYNFLIGGDGRVYVGRGWHNQGAHTKGYNADSYGISFIGTFNVRTPTQQQLAAAQLLLEEGVRERRIAPDYRLYGTRQLSATENPGDALFNIIKTWPHFVEVHTERSTILSIITRDVWLAMPPSKPPKQLELPVSKVLVLSTETEYCNTQASCTFRVRFLQTYHIEALQHDDISYNFLIGGDGNVYVGRGWNHQGAHLKGHNENTISIAYIGTYKLQGPTAKQMTSTTLLLENGVRLGKLSANYKIYSAHKLDVTLSTDFAKPLYESFKGWSHWSQAE